MLGRLVCLQMEGHMEQAQGGGGKGGGENRGEREGRRKEEN